MPNPLLVNEGHDSTMEFAEGNYGLIQGALEYRKDVTPPVTTIEYSAAQTSGDPINFRFNWVGEPSVIYYTTDGSTPTVIADNPATDGVESCDNLPAGGSTRCYNNQGPRRAGRGADARHSGAHTVKWIVGGHQGQPRRRSRSQRLLVAADDADGTAGGTVPATLSLTLGAPATFGAFTPGVAEGLHGVDDGERDLDGRRRDAVGRRPELDEHGPPGQRHVLAAAAAAGVGVQRGRHRRRVRAGRRLGEPDDAADLQRRRSATTR